jgi:hypothetical protein
MRKIVFSVCLLLCFSCIFAENSKNIAEIGGGINLFAMTDYNKSIDDNTRQMTASGYIPDLKR